MSERLVRDIWWEGDTMVMQMDDTGEISRFVGAHFTSHTVEFTSPAPEGIEITEIAFVEMNPTEDRSWDAFKLDLPGSYVLDDEETE